MSENAKHRGSIVLAGLAACIAGILLGALVWALVNTAFFLCDLLWNGLVWAAAVPWTVNPQPQSMYLPVAACLAGGLLMGLWNARFKSEPKPLAATIGAIKSGDLRNQPKPPAGPRIVSFILPIAFGGAVGPAPGLLSIAADSSTWAADRIKALAAKTGATAISRKPVRIVLCGIAALGCIAGIQLARTTIGGIMVLPRFDAALWAPGAFAWGLVLALIGCLIAMLFWAWGRLLTYVSAKLGNRPVLKPMLCGAVLGATALVLPLALFSGSQQSVTLMAEWAQAGASALMATALVKTFCIALCLTFCWSGGPFFPLAFCGITFGYGCAALLGLDPMLCVTVTTCSLMGAFSHKPVLAFLLMLLIFPLESLPFILFGLAVGLLMPMPGSSALKALQKSRAGGNRKQ